MLLTVLSYLVATLVVLASFLYWWLTLDFGKWEAKGLPGIKPEFFFGNAKKLYNMELAGVPFFIDLYKKFKGQRISVYYNGSNAQLLVRDPELCKAIMIRDFDHFTDQGFFDPRLLSLPGNNLGLAMEPEESWRKLKPMLSPLFSPKQLKIMARTINKYCKETVQVLGEKSASSPEGFPIDDIIRRHLLNTNGMIALGFQVDAHKYPDNEMGVLASGLFGDVWRSFLADVFPEIALLFNIAIPNPKAYAYFDRLTKEALAAAESGATDTGILKEIVRIQNDPKVADRHLLTKDMVVGTVLQFFSDGYDTTATNIVFTLYHLALNPHVQERAYEEIEDMEDDISDEDINKLKYMEQVFQENNRRITFPFTSRVCNKEWQIPETKIRVTKGTRIVIPLLGIQNDPQYFENPDEFDPDRFSPENKSKIATCTYMPFGEGPRRCAGINIAKLQAKLLLFHILKHFRIEATDKTPRDLTKPEVWSTSNLLPTLADGLWVSLVPR